MPDSEIESPVATAVDSDEARQAVPIEPRASQLRVGLLAVAVFLSSALAGYWIQSPYRDAPLVLDSVYYNLAIGLAKTGRADWAAYYLAPAGGYLHLLWKAQYLAMIEWHGVDPVAWHAVITAAHALSAAILFVLVLHYLRSVVGALVTAALWAGAAIGNYDNTLLVISSSEQTMSVVWLLAAMWATTKFRSPLGGGMQF